VVLVGEPGRGEFDIGRAAQNMMLAADALGIGSCPATLHDQEAVQRLLGIPEDRGARHAVAFGYPDQHLEPTVRENMQVVTGTARKPLSEVVRRERFS
jgi:nitroreductase